jgi:hypothetical protein
VGTGNPLLGIVYEYMAHRILLNGGNFDVRPLDNYVEKDYDDPDARVNLSKQDGAIMFTKKNTGSIVDGKYCQPVEKNFPSCDSIIAPDKLFQMTLAKHHPIKMSGLKILYNKLGGESENHLIYYYFVVPEHLYDEYEAQKIVNSDDDEAKIIPDWIHNRIFQYVLKIKL